MTASDYGMAAVTDADRDQAYALLRRATAEGRLSEPDFTGRVGQLRAARTRAELGQLTADLAYPPGTEYAPSGGFPPASGYPPAGGYAPAFGYAPAAPPLNQLAVAALSCGCAQIFFSVLTGIPAIVLGHLARRQIRRTGERGEGMALAGLILGYAGVALSIVAIIGIALLVVSVAHHSVQINGPAPAQP